HEGTPGDTGYYRRLLKVKRKMPCRRRLLSLLFKPGLQRSGKFKTRHNFIRRGGAKERGHTIDPSLVGCQLSRRMSCMPGLKLLYKAFQLQIVFKSFLVFILMDIT